MVDVEIVEQDALADLDFFFDGISGEIYLHLDDIGGLEFPSEPSPELPSGSPDSISSRVNEIERFLLEEGDGEEDGGLLGGEDFFADLFADGSDDGSVKAAVSNGDAATPKEAEDGSGDATALEESEKEKNEGSEGESGQDEDLIVKKRRRQMRNRDSAMKSRERKKMYVRDLEVKSRFLESECRRLEHVLHCCAVENLALRQCLQKNGAFGASPAKQESAVLFVESLLLGSLFWLVSIVCLFVSPSTRSPALGDVVENASGLERTRTQVMEEKRAGSKILGGSGSGSVFIIMKRRCKAERIKMKISMLPIYTVLA